jgi:hypothetical protein
MYHHLHHTVFSGLSNGLIAFDNFMFRYFLPLAIPVLATVGVVSVWLRARKPLFATAGALSIVYAAYALTPIDLWLRLYLAA